jgi:uncharacterized protein (TIGR02246 family)
MTKSIYLCACILLATIVLVGQETRSTNPSPAGSRNASPAQLGPDAEPIRQVLQSYIEAFNKHDAKDLAALWMPNGIYVDRSTGERVEGREALESDFASTFKEKPSARLTGTLQSVRYIRPDVVSAEGETVEGPAEDNQQANKTSFSAIFVRQDGRWRIDSVQESDVPVAQTAASSLADLEWMLGHWVDKSNRARVDTTCRWSPRRAFLVRSFTIKTGQDDGATQGTEIIGWDPRTKQIRSWTFLSDGAFGQATWTKDGNSWTRKGSQTLSDGRVASGTQVISRVDPNTITVELIAKEIDGEPQPATDPVTVVRVPDEKAATAPEDQSSPPATNREGRP